MRIQILLLVCLLGIFSECKSQSKAIRSDTIYASSNHITTILFSEAITYLALGTDDFLGTVEGKTVLLKAASSSPIPATTSILIKYGANENIYHGAIAYAAIPPNSFLDFSTKELPKDLNPKLSVVPDSVSIESKMITRRIGMLEGMSKAHYKEFAIRVDHIIISVSELLKDEDYLFVKVLFLNNSKTDYRIEFVDVAYHTPREDRSYQGKDEIKPVPIRTSNEVKHIETRSEKNVVFAVPRFILTSKGFMRVTFHELKGARVLSVDVPYKIIESAKSF